MNKFQNLLAMPTYKEDLFSGTLIVSIIMLLAFVAVSQMFSTTIIHLYTIATTAMLLSIISIMFSLVLGRTYPKELNTIFSIISFRMLGWGCLIFSINSIAFVLYFIDGLPAAKDGSHPLTQQDLLLTAFVFYIVAYTIFFFTNKKSINHKEQQHEK